MSLKDKLAIIKNNLVSVIPVSTNITTTAESSLVSFDDMDSELDLLLKEEKNADILFEKAIRKKFMIRNCSTFPFLDNRYVRFCFMKPKMNDGLLDCIEEAML